MTDMNFEYECALSGITAQGAENYDGDGLEDLPPGWVQVTMTRRMLNPRYLALMQTKEGLIQGAMQMATSQLPDDVPPEILQGQETAIRLQIDAQFFLLERDTAPYITESEVVFLAPPEKSEAVLKNVNQVREMLGMDALDDDDEEDEDPSE